MLSWPDDEVDYLDTVTVSVTGEPGVALRQAWFGSRQMPAGFDLRAAQRRLYQRVRTHVEL